MPFTFLMETLRGGVVVNIASLFGLCIAKFKLPQNGLMRWV